VCTVLLPTLAPLLQDTDLLTAAGANELDVAAAWQQQTQVGFEGLLGLGLVQPNATALHS
jgi:hypothetical protein